MILEFCYPKQKLWSSNRVLCSRSKIARSWVRSLSNARWKWCQSHGRSMIAGAWCFISLIINRVFGIKKSKQTDLKCPTTKENLDTDNGLKRIWQMDYTSRECFRLNISTTPNIWVAFFVDVFLSKLSFSLKAMLFYNTTTAKTFWKHLTSFSQYLSVKLQFTKSILMQVSKINLFFFLE